jgi:hypothetical protein
MYTEQVIPNPKTKGLLSSMDVHLVHKTSTGISKFIYFTI